MSQLQDVKDSFPKQDGVECPSCGRYIGPYRGCPYCGARTKERISIRITKICSITFSVIGVILLWWVAQNRMVPTVMAEEIDNTTNFAYVQMKGICTRVPTFDEKTKALSFQLEDSTGTIWVKAYGVQAEQIYNGGNLPKAGDSVFAEGTVRMKGDVTYMTINLPEKLIVKTPQPIEMDISEISDSLFGALVKTAGIINSVRKYDTSMMLQVCAPLADACIEMNVYFSSFPNVKPQEFERGDTLGLVGMVSSFKGKLQLIPRGENEFWHKKGEAPKRTWTSGEKPPENSPKTTLKELKKDMVGKYYQVDGNILSTKQIKGGVLIQFDDGTDIVTFPIWDRVLETVPNAEAMQKGASLSFTGKVGEYKGKLQIIPTYGPTVIVKPGKAPVPTAATTQNVETVKIADLKSDMIDKQYRVEGVIKKTKEIKGGTLITVTDGTGEMTFPIWDKVKKHIANSDAIKAGGKISFIGKVAEYKGALQIVPDRGDDVIIGEAAVEPAQTQPQQTSTSQAQTATAQTAEPKKIKLVELGKNLAGQIVTIEGQITKTKEIGGGILITIKDGEEYMTTPIWDKVLKELDKSKLKKDATIVLTGEAKDYKGKMEVLPRTAKDVIVK